MPKKLIRDCQTRWSSTYLVIEWLLNVRALLTTVLQELEWDNLATSDWKVLENIHQLLKPFALYTSPISGEEYIHHHIFNHTSVNEADTSFRGGKYMYVFVCKLYVHSCTHACSSLYAPQQS